MLKILALISYKICINSLLIDCYVFFSRPEVRSETFYKYNDDNKLLEETHNYKGEFKSKKVYSYGDNNLMANYKKYNKKMEFEGTYIYSYAMYED